MKYMSKLVLFAAASLLPVSGVLAQTAATADIPFDFICQQKAMPHGSYRVTVLNENAIAVISQDGRIHAMSLVESTDAAHGKGGKLVFHRYGDQYFLSEVQTPAGGVDMQLPTSKSEKQARLNEAKLQDSGTTLVAMK